MATYGKGLICMPMSEEYVRRLQDSCRWYGRTQIIMRRRLPCRLTMWERPRNLSSRAFRHGDEACGGRGETRGFPQAGHMFPLLAKEKRRTGAGWAYGGDSGSVSCLAGLKECGLCCEIMREDGTMMRTPELYGTGEAVEYQIHYD